MSWLMEMAQVTEEDLQLAVVDADQRDRVLETLTRKAVYVLECSTLTPANLRGLNIVEEVCLKAARKILAGTVEESPEQVNEDAELMGMLAGVTNAAPD